MKSIFNLQTREELTIRINSLTESSTPLWGKMNLYQMTKHITFWNDWVLGKTEIEYKQEFLGKLFGKLALKSNVKDDKPIGKNMPAGKAFIFNEKTGNIQVGISNWVKQINDYENFSNENFVHDFFGKMTREQIGIFVYKHNDHHLRQFNS